MNSVILIGRLTRDPEVRYTSGTQMAVARFNLAVDRQTKEKQTDFPSLIAFGKTAEVIEKYIHKGSQVAVQGRLQTGKYDKDGTTVYTTDVVVDRLQMLGKKEHQEQHEVPAGLEGFAAIDDDDLPF